MQVEQRIKSKYKLLIHLINIPFLNSTLFLIKCNSENSEKSTNYEVQMYLNN